ncbi:SDR family oxidoreductase [Croceiramulus getboli]|nr:SDR family oxidoreductase [Flavobacteriaceae bacterium YJPT1-3]
MEKVLIAGATGTTGTHIINILKNEADYTPIAMIRKPEQREQFENKGISTVMADLTKEVSHATKGIDKVIFAAGSKGQALEEVDKKGAMKLVDAAKKDRIKKFVMLSSLGADAPQEAEELQEYLQAKRDADEYLDISGLDYTIVRPGSLNNDSPTGKIRANEKLDNRQGEIPRGDVARVLVRSLQDHIAKRQVFEILNGEQHIDEALHEITLETA